MFTAFRVALPAAFESLGRHPLRAVLTGLGIFIGVLSVSVVVTLGEGAEEAVAQEVKNLGENLITVRPRPPEGSRGQREGEPLLTVEDGEALVRDLREVAVSAPVLEVFQRVVHGPRNTSAQVVGSTPEYLEARGYRLAAGVPFDQRQLSTGARVCLLGPTLVRELFPGEQPLGASVRVGKALFRVIGLLSEKGQTSFGFDQDQLLLLPITTLRSQLLPVRPGEVSQLLVSGAKGEPTDRVTRKVTALLRQRHKLAPLDEDDFDVRDQARMARSQQGIVEVMRTLLLSIALVSLFIGGVGVANIMLVGVAERSREIGTRLSLGARGSDVLLQFLIEAVLFSLLGGTLGVLCSGLAIVPLSAYFGFDMALQPRTVALAFGLSVLLGILSGFLPARRASRLDPVVALRRE